MASIIAVIQASNSALTVCYKIKAAVKDGPSTVAKVVTDIKDLRSVLQRLECLSDDLDDVTKPAFKFLCEPQTGPLSTCLEELVRPEAKLSPSLQVVTKTKRRAVARAMGLGFSDEAIKVSLERIEHCKSSLTLALSVDRRELSTPTSQSGLDTKVLIPCFGPW